MSKVMSPKSCPNSKQGEGFTETSSTVLCEGFNSSVIMPFPGVLWLWHFLYSARVGPHPVSSLRIYTFVELLAFMAGAANQAGDADSSRAPGPTSGLQGSVNVHRGAPLLAPQWQCISSFVLYFQETDVNNNSEFVNSLQGYTTWVL